MEIIKNKNGSVSFKERVYLPNGLRETKTFSRKTDAVRWRAQKRSELQRNESLGIQALKENITFAEMIDLWMKTKIIPLKSAKTIPEYKSVTAKHLKPKFGGIKIRSIERTHADELIESLKTQGLENRTVNKILGLFKQVLNFAEAQGYVMKTPLKHVSILPMTKGRLDYLSQQEILQLLRANAFQSIYPLLVLALNTGMRIGELTGLCWDRINFENGTIEVSRTMTRNGLKESTKTNLVRYIPMNEEVEKTLRILMRKQTSAKFVFAGEHGEPFNPDHYSQRHFEKALKRAEVRRVTCHVLRHTFASQFMMNGGNIYDLQKILGHTKVEMTQVYAHLSPAHMKKAMQTVRFSAEGDMSNSPFLALREVGHQT